VDKKAEQNAKRAHVGAAAIIVATIGRKEAAKPMLEAMAKGDALTKAIIARELPKLPKTPEITEAFKKVYETTPLALTIPPGFPAREALLEASGAFFDAELVEWVTKDAVGLKGEEADTAPIQDATLGLILKLARDDQVQNIDKLARIKVRYPRETTIGKAYEAEIKIVRESLEACKGKGTECWLAKLVEPKSQEQKTQFRGIKAAYMLGVLGDAKDAKLKDDIVKALPSVTNAAVRFVVSSVLDYLSPNGDKALADKLEAIVKKNAESKDKNKMQADAPLKTIIHRLRARAQ